MSQRKLERKESRGLYAGLSMFDLNPRLKAAVSDENHQHLLRQATLSLDSVQKPLVAHYLPEIYNSGTSLRDQGHFAARKSRETVHEALMAPPILGNARKSGRYGRREDMMMATHAQVVPQIQSILPKVNGMKVKNSGISREHRELKRMFDSTKNASEADILKLPDIRENQPTCLPRHGSDEVHNSDRPLMKITSIQGLASGNERTSVAPMPALPKIGHWAQIQPSKTGKPHMKHLYNTAKDSSIIKEHAQLSLPPIVGCGIQKGKGRKSGGK